MPDFIVTIPVADLPLPEDMPGQSVLMAEWTDGVDKQAYLYTAADITAWPVAAEVTGAWEDNGLQNGETYDIGGNVIGTPNFPVTADYSTFVRPLGNDNGRATGILDSLKWQGHQESSGGGKFLETDNRYTSADSPFTLEIIRENIGVDAPVWDAVTQYFTGDYVQSPLGTTWQASQDSLNESPFGGSAFWDFVNSPGWGWSVVMLSADPLRDITARAVGIYTDPECTIFEYTTGSFVQDGSHGNNYYTVCPPGNRLPAPDQVNFALLLGAAQEGFFNLPENSGTTEALFWASDQ